MLAVAEEVTANIYDLLAELNAKVDQMMTAPSHEDKARMAEVVRIYVTDQVIPGIAQERRAAMRGLRAEGLSLQKIADLLGISKGRVAQILE